MAVMQIMGSRPALLRELADIIPERNITGGDTKLIWSADNAEEVDNARRTFERLTKKGFNAYRVKGKNGAQGEQIREFDENAERVILAPAMAGG